MMPLTATPSNGQAACFPVIKRQGGLRVILPSEALEDDGLPADDAAARGLIGPSRALKRTEDDDGEEIEVFVRAVDLGRGFVKALSLLDEAAVAVDVDFGGEVMDGRTLKENARGVVDSDIREWIQEEGSPAHAGYFTAMSGAEAEAGQLMQTFSKAPGAPPLPGGGGAAAEGGSKEVMAMLAEHDEI